MKNIFTRRAIILLFALIIFFAMGVALVEFDKDLVVWLVVPTLLFPFVAIKYFRCPNCGYDAIRKKSATGANYTPGVQLWFPDNCSSCGYSFLVKDGQNK